MRMQHAFLTNSTAFFLSLCGRSLVENMSLSVLGCCHIQQQNLIIIAASLKLLQLKKTETPLVGT